MRNDLIFFLNKAREKIPILNNYEIVGATFITEFLKFSLEVHTINLLDLLQDRSDIFFFFFY